MASVAKEYPEAAADRRERMSELPEKTQEKPVYETPVVVDIDTLQRGEGGAPAACLSGSANISGCANGTAASGGCGVGASIV
jgi:hypothetical protein